jgi:RHS repeat-associated protein
LTQLVGSWLSQQDTFSLPDYYVSGRLRNFRVNRTTMPGSCSSELKFGANCPSGDTITLLHFFYQYDPVGNFATSVDSIAPGNRAIRAANDFGTVDTMTYDLDGNLTERKQGGVTQKYFWNALSQLDSSQYLDNGVLQNTGKHRYDPFGRRVYHFFHGDSVQHLWDGDQTVVELDGSMAVSVKYTYEPGSLSPFSMTRGGATYYYLYDESNNVTALLKQDSTVPNRYRYFPFGFAYPRVEAVTNTHLFQGQPEDPESGLIYMRNRFYTYRMRRFVSEDPIGLAGGINLYTYADNDPVNRSDPLGLQSDEECLEWGVRGSGSMEHGFEATVYCVKYKPPPQRRGPSGEVLNLWGVSSSGFVPPRGPKSVIVPPEACSTERTQAITAFSMSLAGKSATGAVLSYAKSPAAMSLHQASAVGGRFSTYMGVGVPASLLLRSGGVEVRYSSTAANTFYGLARRRRILAVWSS